MLQSARTDLELFSQLHRGQARFWRRRQLRLQRLCDELGDGVELSEPLLVEMQRIDAFLAKASSAMVQVKAAEEEALGELSTEQLEAQLAAELVSSAKSWTPSQWEQVMKIRENRADVATAHERAWQTRRQLTEKSS